MDWIGTWPVVAIRVVFGIALVIAGLVISLWVLIRIFWSLGRSLPEPHREMVLSLLSFGEYSPGRDRRRNVEFVAARQNHTSIAEWVAQRAGFFSAGNLPREVVENFWLDYYFNDREEQESNGRNLSHVEYRLLTLSQTIFKDRQIYWSRRKSGYTALQVSTWLTIAIGLATTILVSLSSTDFGRGDTGLAPAIRVFAIVFPALGTATAAIIGFYRFSDETGRSSQTLASLGQLHGQMALDIRSIGIAPAEGSDRLEARLDEWVKRYNDIQALAEATTVSGGDRQGTSPSGGSPNKADSPSGPGSPTGTSG